MQNFGGTTKCIMLFFEKGLQWFFKVVTKITSLTQSKEFGRINTIF